MENELIQCVQRANRFSDGVVDEYLHRQRPVDLEDAIAYINGEQSRPGNGTSDQLVHVVWFVNDLRVEDHLGLWLASNCQHKVLPIYILDPKLLSSLCSGHALAQLREAIEELHSAMENLGSTLYVLKGDPIDIIPRISKNLKADIVSCSADPTDYCRWTSACLAQALEELDVTFLEWRCPLRVELEKSAVMTDGILESDSYKDYNEQRALKSPTVPFPAPESLLPQEISEALLAEWVYGEENEQNEKLQDWKLMIEEETPAKNSSHWKLETFGATTAGCNTALRLIEQYCKCSSEKEFLNTIGFSVSDLYNNSFGSQNFEVLATLRLVGSEEGSCELAPGEVFSRIFSTLIARGCLSHRQVLQMLDTSEKLYGVNEIQSLFDSRGRNRRDMIRTARDTVEGREWHEILAWRDILTDHLRSDYNYFRFRYWRYNGYLVRYAVTISDNTREFDSTLPSAVLVHGFGASADQWHKIMTCMAKEGIEAFAIDLLGFGHSNKPPLTYTQYLWENNVRSFIGSVVQRNVILAGNSIGGFIATAAAAGCTRDVVKGLVLLNSAGRLLSPEDYSAELTAMGGARMKDYMSQKGLLAFADEKDSLSMRAPFWLRKAFALGLFLFLQGNIKKLCTNLYNRKPDEVTDRLVESIFRDSNDPGALYVIASGAKLPRPRSKNELFEEYSGPILVLQGMADPLGNKAAARRFPIYPTVYEDIKTIEIDAGHCPHDEDPQSVFREFMLFMRRDIAKVIS